MRDMKHTIHLHGAAKKRFGGPFRLDVRDTTEAVRALCQIPGFKDFVEGADWRIVRGKLKRGQEIGEDALRLAIGAAGELHLIPLPIGSGKKGKGIGKIVAGVALIVLSAFTAGAGTMLLMGLSIVAAGVSTLTAKTPQTKDYNDREAKPASKLFNGPVNLTEPGNPYPIAYGRKVRTGSVVAAAGLSTEQLI
jgi:predicted phage tail protein